MGTSRHRTPPAPVSAGPPRAPGPLIAASKKLANRLLVSSRKSGIFVRGLTHGYRARSTSSKLGKANEGGGNVSGALPEARSCVGKRRGNIVAGFRSSGV